jgi:hypothetical protein
MTIIVCFEIATTASIEAQFGVNKPFESTTALILLYLGAFYFLGRELIQVVALFSLGAATSWFYDTTNWLDMAVIIMVFHYSILITVINRSDPEDPGLGEDYFRAGVAIAKAVLWVAVIYFLKGISVDFAVFLGGVFYVVQRLMAFLLAVGIILLAFAQMFFIVYTQQDVCTIKNEDDPTCEFPHCTFQDSFLKVRP